jgi:hypothetical protein
MSLFPKMLSPSLQNHTADIAFGLLAHQNNAIHRPKKAAVALQSLSATVGALSLAQTLIYYRNYFVVSR